MTSRIADHLMARRGTLSALDKARLFSQGVRLRAERRRERAWTHDLEALLAAAREPQGRLAEAAAKLCDACSPVWLSNHCRRVWAFATAMGMMAELSFDAEVLYAAAMLHDLGLTERFFQTEECFSVRSAREARELARAHGAGAERATQIANAILLHLEIRVPLREGHEAHLLQAAAMFDLLGRTQYRLTPDFVRGVLEAAPRGTFQHELASQMRVIADQLPKTRVGFYCRRFKFDQQIAVARAFD